MQMVSSLAVFVEERIHNIPVTADIENFLRLLLEFALQDSLAVSLPIVSAWARILRKDGLRDSEPVINLLPSLLQLATDRLIRVSSCDL